MSASKWIYVIYASVSVLSGISATIKRFKEFVNIKISKQNDPINEVLFYGPDGDEQKEKVGLNNLFCIYYMIVHATHTIDVCVPTLNSETISKCLLNVYQKNLHIKVRIVIHVGNNPKCLKEFFDCGIEIKFIKSEVKLEHEFLLIDVDCEDAVAIIGSLDYEVNRVNCNKDTTLLTSEVTLISSLKREFERVWNSNNVEEVCKTDEVDKS